MAALSADVATIYLVRHADAGDRHRWRGDDRQRPLTASGQRQAEALVQTVGTTPVRRILSSPYLRCVQTVEPLAKLADLPVEDTSALEEGIAPPTALRCLQGLPDGAVACSHGDVIQAVLRHLEQRGIVQPEQVRLEKGSTWILQRAGINFTAARYLPAP